VRIKIPTTVITSESRVKGIINLLCNDGRLRKFWSRLNSIFNCPDPGGREVMTVFSDTLLGISPGQISIS
jgi:hypothetical protein